MSETKEFLSAFELEKNKIYENYVLSGISVVHEVLKKHSEHKYSIRLVFDQKINDKSSTLHKILVKELSQNKIIQCHICSINIDKIRDNGSFVLVLATGYAFLAPNTSEI